MTIEGDWDMRIAESLSSSGAVASSIGELESIVKAGLPEDYRHFLETENGGRPEPSTFSFQQYGGPQDSILDWFFTLNRDEPIYYIPNKVKTFTDRIPPQLLPIACDPLGNLVLLDLRSDSHGSVYFWDHENENLDGEPSWSNISFIAPSFGEFVHRLH